MKFARMALALGVSLAAPPAAEAAYLDFGAWRAAAGTPSTTVDALPGQTLSFTDYYGTYTIATRNDPVPVNVFSPSGPPDAVASRGFLNAAPADGAGQLSGNFGCNSGVFNCLGAYRIEYTLPFAVLGIAGDLSLSTPAGNLADIPFFEFSRTSVDPSTGNPFRYTGFWGEVFDTPTDVLSILWAPGLRPFDGVASFRLSNAVFITASPDDGNGQVPVPEPASMALFGMGLLGLYAARRRR